MMNSRLRSFLLPFFSLLALSCSILFTSSTFDQSDISRLISAMLSDTPIEEDLHELCDKIGGRVTGTKTNVMAVDWAVKKFENEGIEVRQETFTMPRKWSENEATAEVTGSTHFKPRIVARAFSVATPPGGLEGELVLGGYGTEEDFKKLGDKAKGKFLLVKTGLLIELGQLFSEYSDAQQIEARAAKAGLKGLIYMSSRPKKLLFRYLASQGPKNKMTIALMARDDATRCVRIIESGGQLKLKLNLDLEDGGTYEADNVIAEIKGSEYPDEVVLIGAHLDSWGLGTGANDNGCNISMMIDIARQMKFLGIQPKRTLRFALWNGEEQGMWGSYAYTQQHEKELDKHIVATSIDIGSGKIIGFFTGARPELKAVTDKLLEPVLGLGPFENADVPLVGTDNYDFMMQGCGNLIGMQEGSNYCEDYHCESDTYDKVSIPNLKLNSAIVAAVHLGFANLAPEAVTWKRWTRSEIEKELLGKTDLEKQMRAFGHWTGWEEGWRGRK